MEYRGYDSAGIGVLLDSLDKVKIVKKLGKVANLESASKCVTGKDLTQNNSHTKQLLYKRTHSQQRNLLLVSHILDGPHMVRPPIVTPILTTIKQERLRSFITVSLRITAP